VSKEQTLKGPGDVCQPISLKLHFLIKDGNSRSHGPAWEREVWPAWFLRETRRGRPITRSKTRVKILRLQWFFDFLLTRALIRWYSFHACLDVITSEYCSEYLEIQSQIRIGNGSE